MDNLGEYLRGLAAVYPLEKYPERPPEFNLESALVNARRAVQMLHERIGMNLSESSQEVCQDASFFAEFMEEAKSGGPVRLIFSAFGQLVAIDGERILGVNALDQASMFCRSRAIFMFRKACAADQPIQDAKLWGQGFLVIFNKRKHGIQPY